MQIFIFLRNASLYKEFFLAHVNVFFKKVSLYHYSALLSLLYSDNQHVCYSDTLSDTPWKVSSMYHGFGLKYHHFGMWSKISTRFYSQSDLHFRLFFLLTVSSSVALATLSVRIFSPSVTVVIGEFIRVPDLWATSAQTMGNECPSFGHWLPISWDDIEC